MSLFEAHHLSVTRGGEPIVNDVSFSVNHGEVTGLIGSNGAGKTTTLGGILGLYPIHGGSFRMNGERFDKSTPLSVEAKRLIAHIPEQPVYYSDLTLMEHLEWKQCLWNHYQDSTIDANMSELIDDFQLQPHLHKFPHQCSKGTLQKLMVISAFMLPFQLLVIDEPFIGLDILSIYRLKEKVAEAQSNGAAILISTHVLDAAEKMCSHFVLLHDGCSVQTGSLMELKAQAASQSESGDATLEDMFIRLVREQQKKGLRGGESD